ncbi:MAG: 1-deoxy-D-xylulose-5-phosphate reductoisomerase [Nanoarchaeota archaeon]|nr:1-deoxy-D-xylulose-5-phosphate reductoisomerase [Nanoarchaeota archaeon]MBU1269109.1 1-deoxy-D-xylulose-5-phosphate reductoisomerase [Nanoarchaeota archaeon]MBU1604906.1 1-deoxy-D-xylulose-5-phosphate reductoisomerase [Nanoarchaeota archaeon]MBU2443115.1 1-deoxy-D-xylulose-5-phosphate reductoisomerase [Nanoarchaeota archaeon]
MKKIAILGSTGNIGKQVLEVVDKHPDKLKVVALSANDNVELLKEQVKKYKPIAIAISGKKKARELKESVDARVYSGHDAQIKIAAMKDYDMLVNAIVGLSGIDATLEAIKNKKDIALANKETLVSAGEIIMKEAKKNNINIMPIDSEHSAIFQCLNGEKKSDVKRLILTCSGGALFKKTKEELEIVSARDALKHKTWNMGDKITIDSATLMNKGFEVIEAMWLYDLPLEKIDVIIHPQSIIHSMVEFNDGSIIAQLSNPDMKLPIQYALSYPERWESPIESLDFAKKLSFDKPDLDRFPCLKYAYEAAEKGGSLPAAMNAANDYMVQRFLNGQCKFLDIQRVIRKVMDEHKVIKNPTLEEIKKTIIEATIMAEKFCLYC